jgi:hypothetical protein
MSAGRPFLLLPVSDRQLLLAAKGTYTVSTLFIIIERGIIGGGKDCH